MKSIVPPNGAVQATKRIVQLFVCGIFVTLHDETQVGLYFKYPISELIKLRFTSH